MLHPAGESGSTAWKVLVFDDRCVQVLSALFHVQQLQKHGVTILMKLHDKREKIPDTPAVYFVQPTSANLARIAQDCKATTYDICHLNFCYPIPRPLMAELARRSVEGGGYQRISTVFDQYSDFISLDKHLVSLGMSGSFAKLSRPRSEKELMAYVDRIVNSLFSIIVTLGQIPIIRCAPGNAAALAGQRLHSRLREHLMTSNNLFAKDVSYKRPVLVLLDRNMDLSVPLHHPWTYQALVDDIMGLKLNKVEVRVENEGGGTSTKKYDLSQDDPFWSEHVFLAFPQVAEGVQRYLSEYNNRSDSLAQNRDLTDLQSAVNSMPELMKRKRVIDAHTNIATALLKELKERQWDRFFELEEELIQGATPSAQDILKELQPEAKGTPTDKLRLYLVYALCHKITPEDTKAMEGVLNAYATPKGGEGGEGLSAQVPLDVSPLRFLRQFKMEQKFSAGVGGAGATGKTKEEKGLFQTFSEKIGRRGQALLKGVRNLIPTNKSLPVTKIVSALMENKESKEASKFLYYDPKLLQAKGPVRGANRMSTPFTESFVFIMGGGNYMEYQNLQDYTKVASTPQAPVSIAYGSTEILSATQFLSQLSSLGKPATGADIDAPMD